MSATVHVLHSKPSSIGSYLHVGHTGHRKLEALIAASRLRFRRFVFDAAHIDDQNDLLTTLQRAGCEIVFDPNAAGTATLGRFGSSVSALPWGNPDRPWEPSDFGRTRNLDTAKAIAEFAVRVKVSEVFAPTHCIETFPSPWMSIDLRLCEELRHELDRVGGQHIPIDFQLITTNTLLKDQSAREALVASIRHVPAENIIQRSQQIKNLSEAPEARRAEHFLLHHLDPAVRSARLASRLKFADDDIAKLVNDTKRRLTNLRDPLGDLHSASASATRSAAPKFRGSDRNSQSAVG